jgi:hypothetical protein
MANIPTVTDESFKTEVLDAPVAMVDFWGDA